MDDRARIAERGARSRESLSPQPSELNSVEDTSFTRRWHDYAREKNLPADPESWAPMSVAERRREALLFFAHGCGHKMALADRIKEILP